MSPEVLAGDYGIECDCWSLGVIMYTLLCGYLPFYGNNPGEVFEQIKTGKVSFEHKEFEHVSESAKDLILKLLAKDKQQRFTCAQAL